MTKYILISIFFTSLITANTSYGNDPYKVMEFINLDNGLQVVLAPSEETSLTSIEVQVDVGWEVENESNVGVTHLLEHVLFRDKQLKDEMSYLQLIQEAGGSANGSTRRRETNYYGTIPTKKSVWMLENFHRMLMQPQITEEYVSKEKSTIELERGRPNPIFLTLGFNPFDYIKPSYLRGSGFWESEFGIVDHERFSRTEEQFSTRRLTAEQVLTHYDNYYYPSNMRLFIGGKFDINAVKASIANTWAKIPAKNGLKLAANKKPVNKRDGYVRYGIASGSPSVEMGIKVFDASVAEEVVIESYINYLSHRLMKEIRNKKGQTYSAQGNMYLEQGAGFAAVSFDTPKENFEENLHILEEHFRKEAVAGALTNEQVKEAVELEIAKYSLRGREADTMTHLATGYSRNIRERGAKSSPYELLNTVTPEFYNFTLKKYFSKGITYKKLKMPNLLFYLDDVLLFGATVIFSFLLFRRLLTKEFQNDRIKWVRKMVYPPFKIIELGLLFMALVLYMHIYRAIEYAFLNFEILNSSLFINEYVGGVLMIVTLIGCAQLSLSAAPRKLMVVDDQLVIKSVSYYSFKIPLHEISGIYSVRHTSFTLLKNIWKLKHRFFWTSAKFWQKGIIVERNDGRMYFFSVTKADAAKQELDKLLVVDHKGIETSAA